MDPITRILLVRHGETAWNRRRIFRGRYDIPLNDTGRAQARLVAEEIAHKAIEVAYSSPLKRALETARLACAAFECGVCTHEGLLDVDYGDWTQIDEQTVRARWPREYMQWQTKPHLCRPPNGETLGELYERSWAALEQIITLNRGKTVSVFAHRVVNKVLLLGVLRLGLDRFPYIIQDNCCINELERVESDYRIRLLNSTRHIQNAGVELLTADF